MVHREPNMSDTVISSDVGVESFRGYSPSSRVIPIDLGREPILVPRVISKAHEGWKLSYKVHVLGISAWDSANDAHLTRLRLHFSIAKLVSKQTNADHWHVWS